MEINNLFSSRYTYQLAYSLAVRTRLLSACVQMRCVCVRKLLKETQLKEISFAFRLISVLRPVSCLM